ncbi:MAG: LVIVD repeat-containing protein [Candidatus Moraniibacteriota bacterium]
MIKNFLVQEKLSLGIFMISGFFVFFVMTQSVFAAPTLAANWDPNDANTMNAASSVTVDGNYAYVTGRISNNMAIVNISNPANPTLTANWDPNDTNIMNGSASVAINGNYAYIVGWYSNNMAIVDISNPSNPTLAANWDPNDLNIMNGGWDIDVVGNYAYIAGRYSNNIVIVDISNPANPTLAANWDPNDLNIMNGSVSVNVIGNYAYAVGWDSDNMVVLDISNPSNPTLTANWAPNNTNVMDCPWDVKVLGDYAYVVGRYSDNMAIIDVSNPSNPTITGNFIPNDLNILEETWSVTVAGDYAYIAGRVSDNMVIVDISNPANPTLAANWDPNDTNIINDTRQIIVVGNYAYAVGYDSDNMLIIDIADYVSSISTPTTTTNSTIDITETIATGNGNITNTGGEDPERFIEWGTISGTYTNECTAGTGGTGIYSCDITGLTGNTTYYVRSKATNSEGTSYGSETNFTTTAVTQITIEDPDNANIQDVVTNNYISVDNGTIDNTTQTTTQVQVTFQSNTTNAIFPNNTVITEALNGNFNFENFITQNTLNEERGDHPNAVGAVRLGIPNENLTFSNDITMEITVSEAYNDMELEVLSQLEGEVTWNTHTTCTVTNGICTFTTNHATTYIVNGDGTISGIDDLNLNVEVNATLSMDCYDKDGSTGDYDVILGTVANPGIVIAGTPAVGQSTCIVTTNDTQGYYLSMINDNGASNTTLVHSNNTDEIPDLTQFDQTTKVTESWNAPTTKGLGFSVIQFPQADTTNNTFDGIWTISGNLCEEGITSDDADYAGVPQTDQAIAAHTAYHSTSTTTDVCYKVDVSPSQPSGVYTGSVTYTATSDASGFYQ